MKNSISKELIDVVNQYIKYLPGIHKDGDCYRIDHVGWPSPEQKVTLHVNDFDKKHRHAHLEAIFEKCGIKISSLPEKYYNVTKQGTTSWYSLSLPITQHTGYPAHRVDMQTRFSKNIRDMKAKYFKLQGVKFPVTGGDLLRVQLSLNLLNKDIASSMLTEADIEFHGVMFEAALTDDKFIISSKHVYEGELKKKPIGWLCHIDRLYTLSEALGIKWQFQKHDSEVTNSGSKLLFHNT